VAEDGPVATSVRCAPIRRSATSAEAVAADAPCNGNGYRPAGVVTLDWSRLVVALEHAFTWPITAVGQERAPVAALWPSSI
jgi:hypothetical protein